MIPTLSLSAIAFHLLLLPERAAFNLTQVARSGFSFSHRFMPKTGSHFLAR
jgi:hypothetical protein